MEDPNVLEVDFMALYDADLEKRGLDPNNQRAAFLNTVQHFGFSLESE